MRSGSFPAEPAELAARPPVNFLLRGCAFFGVPVSDPGVDNKTDIIIGHSWHGFGGCRRFSLSLSPALEVSMVVRAKKKKNMSFSFPFCPPDLTFYFLLSAGMRLRLLSGSVLRGLSSLARNPGMRLGRRKRARLAQQLNIKDLYAASQVGSQMGVLDVAIALSKDLRVQTACHLPERTIHACFPSDAGAVKPKQKAGATYHESQLLKASPSVLLRYGIQTLLHTGATATGRLRIPPPPSPPFSFFLSFFHSFFLSFLPSFLLILHPSVKRRHGLFFNCTD